MSRAFALIAVMFFVLAAFGVVPFGLDPAMWGFVFFAASHAT